MPNLHHAVEELGSVNRSQTRVDKLLQVVSGCGLCMQEEPANSHQRAVISPNSRHQQVKLRRLRDRLDSAEVTHH